MSAVKKLFQSKKGLKLTALAWLLNHHKAKEQERRQIVAGLNLKPGQVVLDLACGPGLWAPLLAERVSPNGRVVGIDFTPDLIEYAIKNLENEPHRDIIEFVEGDLYSIPFEDNTFDVIFLGNTLAYVTDVPKALEEQKRVLKKGGRLIAKDFDGAIIIFHPIDPYLSLKVLTATAKGLKENPLQPRFDNFVGRKMHGLLLQAGFKDVSTTTYAISKTAPLKPETKRYITGNAEWYVKTAAPYLSEEDIRQWRAHFDPTSDTYILDLPEFYFCMVEMVTVGTLQEAYRFLK